MVKQLSLFNQPSLNINRDLKEQMALSCRESGLSREEILARMNSLASRYGIRLMKGNARALTMSTFEKWLNGVAMEHIPPINSLVVFCAALDDDRAIRVILAPLGLQVVGGADSKLLQWAKEYHRAREARKKMKKLEAEL